ncbi:hypothetical protein INT43_009074 [Umbelopsis isabellina]|uniref:Major facilitator superfamily (MFS) profile domain-containing protein n=1 Tax=Mortierella isabellina TaxID=91625 RepID=A0A8H7U973_MORIS|nr:hypothetical protein INT43_009074 [Umbelopsis isabellina]
MAFSFPKLPSSPLISCTAGAVILWLFFGVRQSFGLLLIPITTDYGWGNCIVYGVGVLILHFCTASLGPLFIVAMGIIVGGAAGGNSFPVVLASIGRQFPQGSKKQALAFGFVSSTGSLGQGCFLPITNVMIQRMGWRNTLLVLGMCLCKATLVTCTCKTNLRVSAALAILCIAVSPLAIFLRSVEQTPSEAITKPIETNENDKSEDKEPRANELSSLEKAEVVEEEMISNQPQSIGAALGEASRSLTFWLIAIGFSVCGFHVSFLATHLPAYLNGRGIDASIAAWSVSILGFGSCFGTAVMGWLCSKYRPKYLLTGLYWCRALMLAIFFWVPLSMTTIYVFSVIFGVLWLSTVPVTTKFIGDVFGFRYLGTLTSLTFIGHQIGAFCGAYIGGVEYDASGSYNHMWYASFALALFAGCANFFANDTTLRGHHPQRVKESDSEM